MRLSADHIVDFGKIERHNWLKALALNATVTHKRYDLKQAGNGPSRRPAQGSKRVKCYNYPRSNF